jgi:PIN domain nuclease of toxin-antitoxin system
MMYVLDTCVLLSQVNIEQVPVDTDLWLESLDLDWGHRDPADRLIVALAKQRDLPILTLDNPVFVNLPNFGVGKNF